MSGQSPADRPARSLTYTAARGVAWTSVLSLAERVTTLVFQFLLAALLPLEIWGAWGIITSVVLFVSGFTACGIREVLVHRADSFRLWSGPAMWLSAVWGVFLSAALAAAAWPVSLIVEPAYRHEVLLGMLAVSPTPLLQSLAAVCAAKMAIDHRFREIALVYSIPGIAQAVLTVALAWLGLRIMAFAAPFTLTILVRMLLMLWLGGVRPGWSPGFRRWKYLVGDVGRVWVETTAVWVRSHGDVLLVGLFVDQRALGLYTFARNMSRQMVTLFTQQVAGVMQPMLVSLRSDPARLLAAFMRASRLLAFLGVPMTLGIAAVMWPGMALVLDETKWSGLPLVLTAMTVGIALRVLTESAVSLKFALGRFREQQRFSIVSSLAFCIALAAGSWAGGVPGASVGFAVFCLITGPLQFLTAVRPVGGGWPETLGAVIWPVVLAGAAIGPWVVLAQAIGAESALGRWLELAMVVVCSAASYLAVSIVMRKPELRELSERLREQSPARLRPMVVRLTAPMVAGGRGMA